MNATIWSEAVRGRGYQVQVGVSTVHHIGRIILLDADGAREAIELRWSGRAADLRTIDLDVAPNSPRGDVRRQITDWLASHGINAVEFVEADAPHSGRA